MPDRTADDELRNAADSLRKSFRRGLEVASSGAFESLAHTVLSCSAVSAPSAPHVPSKVQQSSGDVPHKDLQSQLRDLCDELQFMADEEHSLMASMGTKQHSMCMDATSLAGVKSIVDDAQRVECLVETCSEQMAQLKHEEAQLASRNHADALIAESGVCEMQDALMLCMGQYRQSA